MELGPVERITAGAIGEPGERTFYLQAAQNRRVVSLTIEKQQAIWLAEGVERLFERLGQHVPEHLVDLEPAEGDLSLLSPIVSRFRVSQMGMGIDESRRLVVLVVEGGPPREDDDDDIDLGEDPTAKRPVDEEGRPIPRGRFTVSYDRMLALARHAIDVAERGGRPRCPQCGEPMDPEGHFCARRNGHHRLPDA